MDERSEGTIKLLALFAIIFFIIILGIGGGYISTYNDLNQKHQASLRTKAISAIAIDTRLQQMKAGWAALYQGMTIESNTQKGVAAARNEFGKLADAFKEKMDSKDPKVQKELAPIVDKALATSQIMIKMTTEAYPNLKQSDMAIENLRNQQVCYNEINTALNDYQKGNYDYNTARKSFWCSFPLTAWLFTTFPAELPYDERQTTTKIDDIDYLNPEKKM